jgi:GT2 family glycosyltransferase
MKTAIILPSYLIDHENLDHYRVFRQSLLAYTPKELYDLIIIDNGSKIAADEMESAADFYFRYDEPLGYAKAVNIGMQVALSRFYTRMVVANNDIEFVEPWLEKLNEMYDETGGLLAPQDSESEREALYQNHSWYSLWMIDRKTWEEIGALDDEVLNYRFHDQDYSIRLAKAGKFIGRTGLVHVKHLNSATYKKMGRNEDPGEREEMIRRHGHPLFDEWHRAKSL